FVSSTPATDSLVILERIKRAGIPLLPSWIIPRLASGLRRIAAAILLPSTDTIPARIDTRLMRALRKLMSCPVGLSRSPQTMHTVALVDVKNANGTRAIVSDLQERIRAANDDEQNGRNVGNGAALAATSSAARAAPISVAVGHSASLVAA